jgi:hypothetical protein
MAVICICLAYVALLVLVVRYYHALRRWDDESDALAVKEQERAAQRKATCDAIFYAASDLPPVFLIRHRDGIFITGVYICQREHVPEIMASMPSLEMDASSSRMKHFVGFSVN